MILVPVATFWFELPFRAADAIGFEGTNSHFQRNFVEL